MIKKSEEFEAYKQNFLAENPHSWDEVDNLEEMMDYIEEYINYFTLCFKKYRKWIMRGLLILVGIMVACGSCSYLNKKFGLRDDNPFEEAIEEVVKDKTGLDVDLTPDSKEI